MAVFDLLAWVIGIGTLLYFGAAMLNPAWFIGDETDATTAAAEETRWRKPIDLEDWQHLGQPH